MKYYISKKVGYSFTEAVSKVTESLKNEGFGILTEINIHDKLKEKLDIDFRKYKILGACNPFFAHEALQSEDKIGTMLPCNVVIQELSDVEVEIATIDPIVSMQVVRNVSLAGIAIDIKRKLSKVIDSL